MNACRNAKKICSEILMFDTLGLVRVCPSYSWTDPKGRTSMIYVFWSCPDQEEAREVIHRLLEKKMDCVCVDSPRGDLYLSLAGAY